MSGMNSLQKNTKEEPGEIPGGDSPSLENGPHFQEKAAQGWILKDEEVEERMCSALVY